MKILITGNMGYVGPNVVRELRNAHPGATLVGLDIGYFGDKLTHSEILPEARLDAQHFADVRHFPSEVLQGVDAVVHLAAISNDPMGKSFEEETLDVNYRSSVEIAKKSQQAGVKSFVFASSCSVYGLAEDMARTEESEVNPLTAYAKSKINTEGGLKDLAGDNFKVTCLRFATACGMSDRLRLDLVLNDFVAAAVAEKKILILSDGSPWRPLINVKDMARAIDWAIGREAAHGGDYLIVNVGSEEWNVKIRELAEAVAEVIPGVEVSINKDAQPDKRSYRVDFGLFRQLAPDHQPVHDLKTTIADLKDGLEGMGFADKNFRESSLMRLRALTGLKDNGLLNPKLQWSFGKNGGN